MATVSGVINIIKPTGYSSNQVLSFVKKKFRNQKVGHYGTLDPLATGVLPIAIGRATRLFDELLLKEKEYIAVFVFGKATSTLDADGEILECNSNIISSLEIENALSSFKGVINQIPPQFSAKKINGQPAYSYARNGSNIELKPVKVDIKEFKLIKELSANTFLFKIVCSAGTYIRTLCEDLAKTLNTVGYLSALIRTRSAQFCIDKASTIYELEENKYSIIPIAEVLSHLPKIVLSETLIRNLYDGKIVESKETNGKYLLQDNNNDALAIIEIQDEIIKLKTNLRS